MYVDNLTRFSSGLYTADLVLGTNIGINTKVPVLVSRHGEDPVVSVQRAYADKNASKIQHRDGNVSDVSFMGIDCCLEDDTLKLRDEYMQTERSPGDLRYKLHLGMSTLKLTLDANGDALCCEVTGARPVEQSQR